MRALHAQRVPAGEQAPDLVAPREPERVDEDAGLDLRDVDRLLLLVDAGLHAVVADAVAGARRHRVVDAHQRQRGDRVAFARLEVHLADALFEWAAGERDPQWVLLVALAVLLPEPLRAAVLLAPVTIDAVVDLAARLARRRPRVGELEPVPPALVRREPLDLVGLAPAQRDQLLEVERLRKPQQGPETRPVPAPRMEHGAEAPAVEGVEQRFEKLGARGGQLPRALGQLAAIGEPAGHRLAQRMERLGR